jgi:3-dehydroquinate synthase
MKTLEVDLGDRSYPIFIGENLLGDPQWVEPYVHGQQVLIVSNEKIAPLYLQKTKEAFKNFKTHSIILPDGEQFKTLDVLNKIFDSLLSQQYDRNCTLVALGGGVIGDMTGFAAACYQRGVNFIQIPTTLLAMVDSSVGGKTGVNHPMGKNMIGAFHQPQCVVIDINTLDTLEDRQLSAGLAEIIKYGLIRDTEFVAWLEKNMHKLLNREKQAITYAIETSCRSKAEIVAQDEKEGGVRALLNLGHTFGHAIEAGVGYGNWLHGEAVATGMLMASDLSQRQGWITETDLQRVESLIKKAQLPTQSPAHMDYEAFIKFMAVDKKVRNGKINFILQRSIGDAFLTSDYDPQLLRKTINTYRADSKV